MAVSTTFVQSPLYFLHVKLEALSEGPGYAINRESSPLDSSFVTSESRCDRNQSVFASVFLTRRAVVHRKKPFNVWFSRLVVRTAQKVGGQQGGW
jgi:hypothetical protein